MSYSFCDRSHNDPDAGRIIVVSPGFDDHLGLFVVLEQVINHFELAGIGLTFLLVNDTLFRVQPVVLHVIHRSESFTVLVCPLNVERQGEGFFWLVPSGPIARNASYRPDHERHEVHLRPVPAPRIIQKKLQRDLKKFIRASVVSFGTEFSNPVGSVAFQSRPIRRDQRFDRSLDPVGCGRHFFGYPVRRFSCHW